MRAHVTFRLADGSSVELGHGDFVGRLASAALCLDTPRISEAHAMVSLRGGRLHLLALRGRFAVDGRATTDAALSIGHRVRFSEDIEVEVVGVALPSRALAVELTGCPRQVLTGLVSVLTRPEPELVPHFRADAAAWIWADGVEWRLRVQGVGSRPLAAGDEIALDGVGVRVVEVPLEHAAAGTTLAPGPVGGALHVEARFDAVHIYRDSELALSLGGVPARLVSELVSFDGPVAWQVLAEELWGRDIEPLVLRNRLDVTLARLRQLLRDARVRPDLVRSTGAGHLELVLHRRDTAHDGS